MFKWVVPFGGRWKMYQRVVKYWTIWTHNRAVDKVRHDWLRSFITIFILAQGDCRQEFLSRM